MLKNAVACALLLGAAMSGAQAAEQTWKLSWTGFDEITGAYWGRNPAVWRADKTISAEFTGSDRDGNGLIELPELSKLIVHGWNYPHDYLPCITAKECTGEFEFRPHNNILDLHLKQYFWTEYTSSRNWYHFGNTFGANYTSTGTLQSETHYLWTPETKLTVVTSPVPEPSEWAMFGVGAALLGGIAARRRKAAAV